MKNVKASKKSEFRAVKANSLRAKYLSLMDGTRTIAEIATIMKTSNNNARVTVHCLHRDCGIGHSQDKDGKITAVYPKNVTLADAVVSPDAPAQPEAPANDPADLQQAA